MATAEQTIAKAASHIGERGTQTWTWWNKNVSNWGTGWAWCAAFLSRVFTEAGVKHTNSGSAAGFASQFTRVKDEDVRPGDVVFFRWDGVAKVEHCDQSHVALVESWNHSTDVFTTIEGNGNSTSNTTSTVARQKHDNNDFFTAFFRPVYEVSKPVYTEVHTTAGKWTRLEGLIDGIRCPSKKVQVDSWPAVPAGGRASDGDDYAGDLGTPARVIRIS